MRNKVNLNYEVTVLNSMKNGQSGVICAILFGERTSDIMSKMGLEIGLKISKNENIYQIEKLGDLNIDSNIGNKILIRVN